MHVHMTTILAGFIDRAFEQEDLDHETVDFMVPKNWYFLERVVKTDEEGLSQSQLVARSIVEDQEVSIKRKDDKTRIGWSILLLRNKKSCRDLGKRLEVSKNS